MIISHEKRFIFFHIPKTGGSSITYGLRHNIDYKKNIEDLEIKPGWQNLFHVDSRLHSRYKDNIRICDEYSDYFKFAFVRNPWDLALSWYLALNRNDKNSINAINFKIFLCDFVQNMNLKKSPIKFIRNYRYHRVIKRTQVSYISDRHGNIKIDYLARFEKFKDEFEYIMKTLDIAEYDFKSINVANFNKLDYKNFYDEESKELISNHYKIDIDMLNYEF